MLPYWSAPPHRLSASHGTSSQEREYNASEDNPELRTSLHRLTGLHCRNEAHRPILPQHIAHNVHRPQQDAPEDHQRGLKLSIHPLMPSNACKGSSNGLKRLIPTIMANTAHHETNAHSKRRLKGRENLAEAFARLQGQGPSRRENLDQDIRFFSGKIS